MDKNAHTSKPAEQQTKKSIEGEATACLGYTMFRCKCFVDKKCTMWVSIKGAACLVCHPRNVDNDKTNLVQMRDPVGGKVGGDEDDTMVPALEDGKINYYFDVKQ